MLTVLLISFRARLVAAALALACSPALAAFTVNAADGTVTDSTTGLVWDQCSYGLTGTTCTGGTALLTNWQGALQTAVTANAFNTVGYKGHSDWRLPNYKELASLVKIDAITAPIIDSTVFPNTPISGDATGRGGAWASSNLAPNPGGAWIVYFDNGSTNVNNMLLSYYVRLVRSGQPVASFDLLGTPPVLSALGVSATTDTATTLSATSSAAGTGYWLVVPSGAAAPTAAQVKAGVSYGAVTVTAAGSDATLVAATAKTFSVSGLVPATGYDLYVVAENGVGVFSTLGGPVAFTTVTPTYTITVNPSSPTVGGTVSCSPNPVNYNTNATCTATPASGYTFSAFSGDCTGTTCILTNVTAAKTVGASFAALPAKSYTAPSPGGSGSITAAFTGGNSTCGYDGSQQYMAASALTPTLPAAGVSFPQGLLGFTTTDCGVGAVLGFTVTYPQTFPAGTQYYKFGPEPGNTTPHWYVLPATISGNQITFSITDNGLGDSNPAAGFLTDPGGPGVLAAPVAGNPTPVPTLGEWGLMLLAGLMGLVGLLGIRARRTL